MKILGQKMLEKLSLTLAENSFDFLNSAVKYARGKDARDWKYALLNLASALELMMKAVLKRALESTFREYKCCIERKIF